MIEKINDLKSKVNSNEVKSLCETAISLISSSIYNGVNAEAKLEIEKIALTNLFEGLSNYKDIKDVNEWLLNQKRVYNVKNLGVKDAIYSLKESIEVKSVMEPYKEAVLNGVHEACIYESFISALSPFGYFPTVGNAIEAIKDRVSKYKNDVDITKIIETMKETRSSYLVPLIENVVNNYLENKNNTTKYQLTETLMKFTYDPFVRDIVNLVSMDATELQLEHANAECDIQKVYSPIMYLGENEAIFAVDKSYYIKKGNNVSRLPKQEVSKLDNEFKTLCETLTNPNIVVDKNGITIYGAKDKAYINENTLSINGKSFSIDDFKNAVAVSEWSGNSDFYMLVEFLRSNFNEIAEIDFVKKVYLKENQDYSADVFKLRDNVFITTHNPKLGKSTFYRNINPIQAKNIMMEHLRYDVTSLYKGLLPDEQKINEEISETKQEYNDYISELQRRIAEFEQLPYMTSVNEQVIKALQDELNEVKNEYKDYLNNIERYQRAEGINEEISIDGLNNQYKYTYTIITDDKINKLNGKELKNLSIKEINDLGNTFSVKSDEDLITYKRFYPIGGFYNGKLIIYSRIDPYSAGMGRSYNEEVNEEISIDINVDGKKYTVPIPKDENGQEVNNAEATAGTEVGQEQIDNKPASAITFDEDNTELLGDTPSIPEDKIDMGSQEAEEEAEETEKESEEEKEEAQTDAEDNDIKIEDEADTDEEEQDELKQKDKEKEEGKKKLQKLESTEGHNLEKTKYIGEDSSKPEKKKKVFLKKKVTESVSVKKKLNMQSKPINEIVASPNSFYNYIALEAQEMLDLGQDVETVASFICKKINNCEIYNDIVTELLNDENPKDIIFKYIPELVTNESVQIGDDVIFDKQRGNVIGQIGDNLIVQVQGSSHFAKENQVKVKNAKVETLKPPFKFSKETQKLVFEQYVKCGIFVDNTAVKTNDCYVKYSDWKSSNDSDILNVIIENQTNLLPKSNIKIFEDVNNFANLDNYVEGVEIDESTGEAIDNIRINAIDYINAIGDAEPVRVIRSGETNNPITETLPKAKLRTLSI